MDIFRTLYIIVNFIFSLGSILIPLCITTRENKDKYVYMDYIVQKFF